MMFDVAVVDLFVINLRWQFGHIFIIGNDDEFMMIIVVMMYGYFYTGAYNAPLEITLRTLTSFSHFPCHFSFSIHLSLLTLSLSFLPDFFRCHREIFTVVLITRQWQ